MIYHYYYYFTLKLCDDSRKPHVIDDTAWLTVTLDTVRHPEYNLYSQI